MASEHKYKLIYFNLRGRAEPVRMMMALAGQEYEEENPDQKDWPVIKGTTPLRFLPILETEDGKLSQSVAIYGLVATRLGFQPESDWYKAQSDSVLITASELLSHIGSKVYIFTVYKFAPEPEDMPQTMEACREEIKKKYDFFATTAKSGAKFMFGDKMMVADITLYSLTEYLSLKFPDTKTVNDWVKGWLANMDADEKFANYIKNRKPSVLGT